MSKRFLYASLGVLALALAWNLGARSARADWDPDALTCVAGADGREVYSWTGEGWRLDQNGTWVREPGLDLPVAASDVQVFTTAVLITKTGNVWHFPMSGQWEPANPFPGCGGTATTKDSWGGVKSRWR